MQKEIDKTGADMLHLIRCALHDVAPDAGRVAGMDFEKLFAYSRWHTLDAITYMALSKLEELPQSDVMKEWRERRFKATRKNVVLDAERKNLLTYMDEKNIWYMPLKGAVLKDLYTKHDMRQMADNDILFDATCQKEIRDYFVSHGYEVISYAKGNHDVYEKPPVYNFEMHTALFGAGHNEMWAKYYENVKERLVKNETGAGYHFTDEDFYVYFVAHAFKHFDGCGTGIRSFVDCYVYRSVKELDDSYIEKELEKLNLSEFEKTFCSASEKVFGKGLSVEELTEEEYKMLSESMYSGTYGTTKAMVSKKLRKLQGGKEPIADKTKLRYYLRRLFPDMEFYKSYYPVVYKVKILIPFFIIYRMLRGAIFSGKRLAQEAVMVWKEDR